MAQHGRTAAWHHPTDVHFMSHSNN